MRNNSFGLIRTILLLLLFGRTANAQTQFQVVEPVNPADLVYSYSGTFFCNLIGFLTGSDPCHAGIFTGANSVTEADNSFPNAVHASLLTEFESRGSNSPPDGFRGSRTTIITPTSAQRSQILAYLAAKRSRPTFYDYFHISQKGGFSLSGPCYQGNPACWDGFDYYDEFDCVGLTERAYEVAGLDPTPAGTSPGTEGIFFLYPSDQYFSSATTYPSVQIPTERTFSTIVKSKFWTFFYLSVPAGRPFLKVSTTASGNVDLYVKKTFLPTMSSFDCAATSSSGNETCQIANPTAGVWTIGVYGYDSGGAVLGGGALPFSFSASYTAPAISVTPTSLGFGSVQVGSFADQNFTVQNIGGGILSGNATVAAPFSVVSGATYALAAGQTQRVTVRFSPTQTASFSGTAIFSGGNGAILPVTGSGISPPTVQGLTINPSTVAQGRSATGTLTLSSAALLGGSVVSLSSSDTHVTVPATTTVPMGSTTATFNITTTGTPLSDPLTTTITATLGNSTARGTLTVTPALTVQAFNLANLSGMSLTTAGTSTTPIAGYATIQPNPGSTTPYGVAIFGVHQSVAETGQNVLVTEAGVPASPLIQRGRIYAETNGPRNTGLAIANPGDQDAVISFFFTDSNGQNFGAGTMTIPAGQQIAKFLNEPPFNSGTAIQGTFTFSATVPVSVCALRTLSNERGEFLISTLPVVDLSAAAQLASVLLPQFADGGGWATSVILVNPTDNPIAGTIQFRDASGVPTSVTARSSTVSSQNDGSGDTFTYSVPPRSSFKLVTAGGGTTTRTGSVTVLPTANNATPVSLAIFASKPADVTVVEAGTPAISGTALRMYVESSGTPGAIGSIQTAVAIANPSANQVTVNLQLFNLDGTSAAPTATLTVPASGKVAQFVSDFFTNLPQSFKGLLRVSSTSSPLSVLGLRSRYNERGDFLITTTPPSNESVSSTAQLVFPQLVDGGGYTTQLILFSATPGQASGNLTFASQSGTNWNLVIAQPDSVPQSKLVP